MNVFLEHKLPQYTYSRLKWENNHNMIYLSWCMNKRKELGSGKSQKNIFLVVFLHKGSKIVLN